MPPSDPLEDHVGAMLAEATRLHKEAMSCLDKPNADPLPQLHRAERLLNEAEILAADAASYVDATQMDTALAELHRQHGQVTAMIVQVETAKGRQGAVQAGLFVAIVLLICAALLVA